MIHHSNDELVADDSKSIGWAMTYRQAKTKAPSNAYPRVENANRAFVFWPMTADRVRRGFVVVNEPLYVAGKLNVAAIERAAG